MRFAYRLARQLGYRTGHELLADLTPREWSYWCASERLDPDGGLAELASLVASQIINAIQGVAAGLSGRELDDDSLLPVDAFVPGRHDERAEDQMKSSIMALKSLKGW